MRLSVLIGCLGSRIRNGDASGPCNKAASGQRRIQKPDGHQGQTGKSVWLKVIKQRAPCLIWLALLAVNAVVPPGLLCIFTMPWVICLLLPAALRSPQTLHISLLATTRPSGKRHSIVALLSSAFCKLSSVQCNEVTLHPCRFLL